jgi:integrase
LRHPFAEFTAQKLIARLSYLVEQLHKAGKLAARYSCHDLRHGFAVRIYRTTRDIYAVSRALGHANIGVTETYLSSLKRAGLVSEEQKKPAPAAAGEKEGTVSQIEVTLQDQDKRSKE